MGKLSDYQFEIKGKGRKNFFTQEELFGKIFLYEKLGLGRDIQVGNIPKDNAAQVKKLVESVYGEVK